MARVRAELALGASTREALQELRRRVDSPRVDAFAAAMLSQQLAGGDLATLLRRFAAASADRDRTEADARSATAQARFTGLLVVAMPVGAALLAELLDPGFVGGLLADPAAAALLIAAAALQLAGFAAIRRLCRVDASVSAPLAAVAVLLAFAAAWELAGSVGEQLGAGARRRVLAALRRARRLARPRRPSGSGFRARIDRAGLADRLEPRAVVAAKLAGAAAGALVALVAAPAISPPARAGAGRGPRRGRLPRAGRLAGAGRRPAPAPISSPLCPTRSTCSPSGPPRAATRSPGSARSSAPASGPLAAELARTVAEVECGQPLREAIEALRGRVGGAEVGALAAALERSRTYGSPLAEQLHLQATSLRREARRRIEERAARAAPKIQLVVALVLVPSVLLTIVAAIVAHSDALLGQF